MLSRYVLSYDTGFYAYLAGNGNFSYERSASFDYPKPVIIPSNINSRNYFHRLVALKDGKVTRFSFSRDDAKEKLLTGTASSMGVVHKNYYYKLNETSFYNKGYDAPYPYRNFQEPMFVLVCTKQYLSGERSEQRKFVALSRSAWHCGKKLQNYNKRIIAYIT